MKLIQTLLCISAAVLFPVGMASADSLPEASRLGIMTGMPQYIAAPVVPGQTQAILEFPIGATERFSVEVIAPVASPSLSVSGPLGPVPADISYSSGDKLDPPLPGGMFHIREIIKPENGVWRLTVSFPTAVEKTVIQANVNLVTPYRTGFTLLQDTYLLGEAISAGMIVLNNGAPVLDAQARIDVISPTGVQKSLALKDNGDHANLDGQAKDGIYSQRLVFDEPGQWMLTGTVQADTPQGEIERVAYAFVNVEPPAIRLENLTSTLVTSETGCVSGLNLHFDTTVLQPGKFTARAALQASNQSVITRFIRREAEVTGPFSFDLLITSEELMSAILEGAEGAYAIALADLLTETESGDRLDARYRDAGLTPPIELSALCLPMITFGLQPVFKPYISNNFIYYLDYSLPIFVGESGNYHISHRVVDRNGVQVATFSDGMFMEKGPAVIEGRFSNTQLMKYDGPLTLRSVAIFKGGTGESSFLATSLPGDYTFERWQVGEGGYAKTDLNGDGVSNETDRLIIFNARGQKALSPGDRRDLNKDGKIDGADVIAWQNLMRK